MLAASSRLRSATDIRTTLQRGRRLALPAVHIYYLKRPEGTTTRVACVVSKRVHQSAVQRHRYQRWLRVVAREVLTALPRRPAFDMVWIAQPALGTVASAAALKDLVYDRLLHQLQ